MKVYPYVGLAGFALLTVYSLVVATSAVAIEKVKYRVLEKEDGF